VKTHAVAIDELADWRVPAFRQFREEDVPDDEKDYKVTMMKVISPAAIVELSLRRLSQTHQADVDGNKKTCGVIGTCGTRSFQDNWNDFPLSTLVTKSANAPGRP
jgi:hypothetical protein